MERSQEETHRRGEKVDMPTQGSYFETFSTIRIRRICFGFVFIQPSQVFSCLPVPSYEQISFSPSIHRYIFGFPVSSGEPIFFQYF